MICHLPDDLGHFFIIQHDNFLFKGGYLGSAHLKRPLFKKGLPLITYTINCVWRDLWFNSQILKEKLILWMAISHLKGRHFVHLPLWGLERKVLPWLLEPHWAPGKQYLERALRCLHQLFFYLHSILLRSYISNLSCVSKDVKCVCLWYSIYNHTC